MKIQGIAKYKSIGTFSQINLPDFVIISGVNGSGKTQLLEAISFNHEEPNFPNPNQQKHIKIFSDSNIELKNIKYVSINSLNPHDAFAITAEQVKQNCRNAFNNYNNFINNKKTDKNLTINQYFSQDKKTVTILNHILKITRKKDTDLAYEDIHNNFPLGENENYLQKDIFYQNFSYLFKQYQIKQIENEFNQFYKEKKSNAFYLSDEEFINRYGEPPWLLANKIIKEAKLDYQLNSPEGHHRDEDFDLKIINNINKAQLNFSDLSGGEKVLMSLALALYNSKFSYELPDVLLMDEPDALLHPSMSKQFLDVIQNVFIKEKNVKVIITTHSPSTVAIAPDESLYIMQKNVPRLIKATKDKALKILTSGIPSLSIEYENRRQVFVESKYDVEFYEKIYDKIGENLNQDISISFISSGLNEKGDCDKVKEIVRRLTEFGNKKIYGIIDWDKKNNPTTHLKVLGKGIRYSMDNYILDTIFLSSFLLDNQIIQRDDLNLNKNETYYDFKNFEETRLQNISDYIITKINSKLNNSDLQTTEIQYQCGKRINVPDWFLKKQGHDLELIILEVFPKIKSEFSGKIKLTEIPDDISPEEKSKLKKENEIRFNKMTAQLMKTKIITKIIDNLPEFIPIELIDLMKEIQDYNEIE